jgi:creatinine amidohydrolase
MNWVDFDALRAETDLALIPLGAVEVYGPHLPLGADGIATTALAARVAERVPAFVAPLIPVGYSAALDDFPAPSPSAPPPSSPTPRTWPRA